MTTVQAMVGAILAWAPTILVFIYIVRETCETREASISVCWILRRDFQSLIDPRPFLNPGALMLQ